RGPPIGHIQVLRINELLQDMWRAIDDAGLPPAAAKKRRKREAKARKKQQPDEARRRVFVLNFEGDVAASGVDSLRREISAVLGTAKDEDEVVVRVDSAGGTVHGYGLGASQLARVRSKGVKLTVAVDKIAASGGYMMAAVADRVLAAPFAVVGSIGVVAQIPNVHRLLKRHDVDVEVLTAGRYKRTLDILGENTDEGREKLRDELHDIHALFQEFIGTYRPALDLEEVSTGEAWFGQRALDRSLVDELVTSDEYLASACQEADIFEVSWVQPKKPIERLFGQATLAIGTLIDKVVDRTMGGLR
ncbi:MAG: protease SohB, partial [Gammaproteobacteria bacterium]|nr:protease SohB [Gammaproteobacteria bacterium]